MLQEKQSLHNFQKKKNQKTSFFLGCKDFSLKFNYQNIKINNDTKKTFDISFYFVETNNKSIFCNFFLTWLNTKKISAKLVNFEVHNRKNIFHKNLNNQRSFSFQVAKLVKQIEAATGGVL